MIRWLLVLALSGCGGGGCPTVTVDLFGDSTQAGAGDSATSRPEALLQLAMDAEFGAGRVVVTNKAISGTNTRNLINGERGYAKWPASASGDVVVVMYGVNDSTDMGVDEFRANLRILATRATIFETPVPVIPRPGEPNEGEVLQLFAQALRDIANEQGIPVADANAAVLATPGWQTMYSDGFHHPGDALQGVISKALAPIVVEQAKVACERSR